MSIAPDGDTRDTNVPADVAGSITLDDLRGMRISIGDLEDSIASLAKTADRAVAEASFEIEAAKAIEHIVGLVMKHAALPSTSAGHSRAGIRSDILSRLSVTGGLGGIIDEIRRRA